MKKHNYLKKIEIKTTISNNKIEENDKVYSNVLEFNQEGITVLTDYKTRWYRVDKDHVRYEKSHYKKYDDWFHRETFSENFTAVLKYLNSFKISPTRIHKKIISIQPRTSGIYKNQRVKADVFITHTNGVLALEWVANDHTPLQASNEESDDRHLHFIKDQRVLRFIIGPDVLSKDYEPFPWLEGETFVIEMPEDFLEEKLLPTFINNLKKIAKKNQVILITNIMSDLNLTDVSPREVEAVKKVLKGCKAQSMEFSGEHSSPSKEPLNIHLY
jgi:hypothetical protein